MKPRFGGGPNGEDRGEGRRLSGRRANRYGNDKGPPSDLAERITIVRGVEGKLGGVPPLLVTSGGDGRRDVFQVPFDPATEDVVEVILRSVAVIQNEEPAELPALGDVVETDALSAIFGPSSEEFASEVQVTFAYEDLEITVTTDGDVWLEWA